MSAPFRKFSAAWNRFFFDPISPATIGIFRAAYGVVVFLNILGKFPFRNVFYSDSGIVSYHSMDFLLPGPAFLFFRWVPDADPWLGLYFAVILVATVTLSLGLFTRVSSIVVYLGLVSLSNRDGFVDNAGDIMLRSNAFFLMFSEAGSAYSLDRLIGVRRGTLKKELEPSRPWAQRAIQLQLSFVYLQTAYLKMYGPAWRDGTAMYYALKYLELRRFDFKYIFYYLWQIKVATYGTLVAEGASGSLIWVRRLRYYIIAAAFALHVGINLTMQFPIFQYVMMASLLTFIYPEDMERIITWLERPWVTRAFRRGPAGRTA